MEKDKAFYEQAIKTCTRLSRRYATVSLTVFFSLPAILIYSIVWDWWTWKPWVIWLIILFVDRTVSKAISKTLTDLRIKLENLK